MIIRSLITNDGKVKFDDVKHYCLGIFDDNLECWEYTAVRDAFGVSESLRIQARLLCKGSLRDEVWFTDVYCAWRVYIAKDAIFHQAVSLLSDIERYAAMPGPRPFEHDHRIFIVAREFILDASKRMAAASAISQHSPTGTFLIESTPGALRTDI